jgi:CRP-like cAMP-binding protein
MNKSALRAYLKSIFPHLDEYAIDAILLHATYLTCTKGTKLICEGKRHPYFYLIRDGSVKSYYQKDSKEICLWFAFENEVVSTIKTFEGEPSNETIELLEDSKLIRFKTEPIKELAQIDLSISHWIIGLITDHAVFLEERLYGLQFMTSQERYEALIEVAPEILQKVSLTDIASFLGVSRETLSRIRAKK